MDLTSLDNSELSLHPRFQYEPNARQINNLCIDNIDDNNSVDNIPKEDSSQMLTIISKHQE